MKGVINLQVYKLYSFSLGVEAEAQIWKILQTLGAIPADVEERWSSEELRMLLLDLKDLTLGSRLHRIESWAGETGYQVLESWTGFWNGFMDWQVEAPEVVIRQWD